MKHSSIPTVSIPRGQRSYADDDERIQKLRAFDSVDSILTECYRSSLRASAQSLHAPIQDFLERASKFVPNISCGDRLVPSILLDASPSDRVDFTIELAAYLRTERICERPVVINPGSRLSDVMKQLTKHRAGRQSGLIPNVVVAIVDVDAVDKALFSAVVSSVSELGATECPPVSFVLLYSSAVGFPTSVSTDTIGLLHLTHMCAPLQMLDHFVSLLFIDQMCPFLIDAAALRYIRLLLDNSHGSLSVVKSQIRHLLFMHFELQPDSFLTMVVNPGFRAEIINLVEDEMASEHEDAAIAPVKRLALVCESACQRWLSASLTYFIFEVTSSCTDGLRFAATTITDTYLLVLEGGTALASAAHDMILALSSMPVDRVRSLLLSSKACLLGINYQNIADTLASCSDAAFDEQRAVPAFRSISAKFEELCSLFSSSAFCEAASEVEEGIKYEVRLLLQALYAVSVRRVEHSKPAPKFLGCDIDRLKRYLDPEPRASLIRAVNHPKSYVPSDRYPFIDY